MHPVVMRQLVADHMKEMYAKAEDGRLARQARRARGSAPFARPRPTASGMLSYDDPRLNTARRPARHEQLSTPPWPARHEQLSAPPRPAIADSQPDGGERRAAADRPGSRADATKDCARSRQ
jgi:hypothetical protein